jgi:HPr kinase/phosphorylase
MKKDARMSEIKNDMMHSFTFLGAAVIYDPPKDEVKNVIQTTKDANISVVMITGDSGLGKSEAALEMIRRGHRLVSDDVVEIKKVSDETLIGTAPDITRHFIELRGIGIIDVKSMFGVECVKHTQSIDLIVNLEEWDKDANYDRLGLEDQYTEILGNKIVSHSIPIRPGRNIAVIVEAAAVNHRQKKMGYNAAQELYNRVTQNIAKNSHNV